MSTFCVSATAANGIAAGNDQTGNGSRERPWATIGHVRMAAANGDTVYLNDGVYSPSDGVYAPAKTLEINIDGAKGTTSLITPTAKPPPTASGSMAHG
jgi:hypothetical protein